MNSNEKTVNKSANTSNDKNYTCNRPNCPEEAKRTGNLSHPDSNKENVLPCATSQLTDHIPLRKLLSAIDNKKNEVESKPCCSKTIHRTPHSGKNQVDLKTDTSPDGDFYEMKRRVPDCMLNHPDCVDVWKYMIHKEEASQKLRNPRIFNDSKCITPRMRAILLDWVMEVSEACRLRRVTYYLSVDYFDRYLSIQPNLSNKLVQLVGVTCLYIASKVEEIYPPSLAEFWFVCDDACTSEEIVQCERLILNSLEWDTTVTTPSDWLNLYMQLHYKSNDVVGTNLNLDFNKDFIFPQYSAYQFTRASQLMDLFSLDPGFLKFDYNVVAAAAMFYIYGEEIAMSVSGLSWQQLKPCVDYMEAFYIIVKNSPDIQLLCLGPSHLVVGARSENYSLQTHVVDLKYLEEATIYRLSRYSRQKSEMPSAQFG